MRLDLTGEAVGVCAVFRQHDRHALPAATPPSPSTGIPTTHKHTHTQHTAPTTHRTCLPSMPASDVAHLQA